MVHGTPWFANGLILFKKPFRRTNGYRSTHFLLVLLLVAAIRTYSKQNNLEEKQIPYWPFAVDTFIHHRSRYFAG